MKKRLLTPVATTAILLFSFGLSQASQIEFDFWGSGSGNINKGSNEIYSSLGYDITASAWDYTSGWTADDILENNRGNREQGLGVAGGYSEIDLKEVIELDLTSANLAGLSDWQIRFNSIDGVEVALLYGSNTRINSETNLFASTTLLQSVPGGDNFVNNTLWFDAGNWNYLYILENQNTGSSGDDVLVYGARAAAPVPEPATMLLFATGLAGLVGVARRKKK